MIKGVYVTCPGCRRKLGPYASMTTGTAKCAHCGKQFRVTK